MNELIPIMVIIPLIAALLISAFSKFNKVTKIFAFVVAICLPIIPLLSNYGFHYFGGYEPILEQTRFITQRLHIHLQAYNKYS